MNLLVKCKHCGNENPVGDLFCRQCGAEIDMNDIDPRNMVKPKKTGRMRKFIDTVSSLLVFVGLVTVLCLFIPSSVEVGPLDEANAKLAAAAIPEMEAVLNGKPIPPKDDKEKPKPLKTHILLEQKLAGAVFKDIFLKGDQFAKTFCAEQIDAEGNVTAVMKTRIFGFPFKIVISGKLEPVGREDLFNWKLARNTSLAISDTKVGLIPLGVRAAPLLRRVFFKFMDENPFKEMAGKIDTIKITREKQLISIYMAQPEKAGSAK